MEEINEIKLPEGVDRISVKQDDDKIVIEFIPKEPKFKNGDFVYEDGRIMIVKSYPSMYHANLWHTHSDKPSYNGAYVVNFSEPTFRLATEEEKQILIDAMKKGGKRFNDEKLEIEDMPQPKFKVGDSVMIKEGISSKTHRYTSCVFLEDMDKYIGKKLIVARITNDSHRHVVRYTMDNDYYFYDEDWLEPYTEEAKKGDLAIFWDNAPVYPLIRLYHAKQHNENRYCDNFGAIWDNAVKWDGTKAQFEKILNGEI